MPENLLDLWEKAAPANEDLNALWEKAKPVKGISEDTGTPSEMFKAAKRGIVGVGKQAGLGLEYLAEELKTPRVEITPAITETLRPFREQMPQIIPDVTPKLEALGKRMVKASEESIKRHPEWQIDPELEKKPWYTPKRLAVKSIEAAPLTVAGMGAGAVTGLITKNPFIAAGVSSTMFGLASAGEIFNEAKEAGMNPEDALKPARLGGLGEGMLEFVPGYMFMRLLKIGNPLSQTALKEGVKELGRVSRIARGMGQIGLAEGLEEGLQTAKDNLIAGKYYEPSREILKNVPESAALGAIMGVGLGGAGAVSGEVIKPSIKAGVLEPEMPIIRQPGKEEVPPLEEVAKVIEGKSEVASAVSKEPWQMTHKEFGKTHEFIGQSQYPVTWLRFGTPPESGLSMNWITDKPEKGVSVLASYKDPITGKYVIETGGEDLSGTIGELSNRNIKLYEVTGDRTGEVGGDFEHLLSNVKVIKEIPLSDVVYEQDPWLPLEGNELSEKETPDIKKQGVYHYDLVKKAISEGKPVPLEVLKDYPELQKQTHTMPSGEVMTGAEHKEPSGTILHNNEVITKTEAKEIIAKSQQDYSPKAIKQHKEYLFDQIDEAIKNAKDYETLPIETRYNEEGKYPQGLEPIEDSLRKASGDVGFITIEVPGDGKFRIINSKQALEKFKKDVVSKISTSKTTVKKTSEPPVTSIASKATGIRNVMEGTYKGSPAHSNGEILLFSNPKIKPKSFRLDPDKNKVPLPSDIDSLINKETPYYNVDDIRFTVLKADEISGVSDKPIAHEKGDLVNVELYAGDKYAYISQDYYNYIKAHFPDAKFKITGESGKVIEIYSDKKRVGLVMPLEYEQFAKSLVKPSKFIERKPEPGTQPGEIETELKSRVDEVIGDVVPPVGLSIKTVGVKKIQEATAYEFTDAETEARWKEARTIKKESVTDRGKAALNELWHKMSRGAYEHLPRTAEFSQLRFGLSKLAKQKRVAMDKTLRDILGITINFKQADRNIFDRKVILEDFKETAAEGKELPFGFTKESVAIELERINTEITKYPEIQKAVELRKELWNVLRETYTSAMKNIGEDVSGIFTKENYFRHQVLDYIKAQGLFGTGKRLKTPRGRSFQKKRKGSVLDIATDYIQAEAEVISQILYDIEVAKTIKMVMDIHDVSNQVKAQAKIDGLKDWHDAIPEGYVLWQPREGNLFYMADTIPAKLANQLTEGQLEEVSITANDLGKALAMGGKRREFVVKEEVAKTLDNLIKNKNQSRIIELDKTLLRLWKEWQLISPRRIIRHNTRNLTGDAEAAFLGNPSGFKKTIQSFNELYATLFGNKSMTPTMQDFFERGGFETTLQAQELREGANNLKIFVNQYNKKTGIKEIPAKLWKEYWRIARLTTDFREAILRYANYLDYVEQMAKNPEGRPRNFGASIPEEVMALPNIKDRAFKLQNELLGAYDDISILGQAVRDHLFSFWSWKEVNMKRYYRLYKNASNDRRLAETVGRHILGGIVTTPYKIYRVGKFVITATAFFSVLQVWNHFMFPDEEDELPENKRARPHIVLGRDKDGKIITFDRIGTLGDYLEWFGLDASPKYVKNWLNGKMTLKEIAIDMVKSPVNVIVQGLTPYFKIPAELLARKQFFPDFTKPRTIRNTGLYLAQSLGLENEYKALMGLPSKKYTESLPQLFYYKIDPYEAAYSDIYNEKRRFLEKIGKGSEGSFITPRGDALYNLKLAVRYKDTKAAKDYMMKYFSLGGTVDGIGKSFENLSPLAGLTNIEQKAFIKLLNEDDSKNLIKAFIFYDRVLLGKEE
ncbi:MAG: hypothetical protein NUV76_12155 [Candidatus Kuenenia sp.]|nr:hypothetical protein [Candidatus Kuenenia sp.]